MASQWSADLQRQDQESLAWEISIIAMHYTITLFSMAAVKQSVVLYSVGKPPSGLQLGVAKDDKSSRLVHILSTVVYSQ